MFVTKRKYNDMRAEKLDLEIQRQVDTSTIRSYEEKVEILNKTIQEQRAELLELRPEPSKVTVEFVGFSRTLRSSYRLPVPLWLYKFIHNDRTVYIELEFHELPPATVELTEREAVRSIKPKDA